MSFNSEYRKKEDNMKKGFTLIELLAVIIILAVIALIATPIVLNVVDNAKESARKSSVAGFADAVKLARTEAQFNNLPFNDNDLSDLSIETSTNNVTCEVVKFTNTAGIILNNCTVQEETNYCYKMGTVEKGDNCATLLSDVPQTPVAYAETGVNSPDLLDGMIPVKYDIDHWVYADISEKWFEYGNNKKEWANAVILKSGVTKQVGDTITENDIALWYVWIPRYKYTIFNGNNGSAPVQQINVTFESGTYSTGTVHCTDQITAYENEGDEIDTTSVSETCSDADQAGNAVVNGESTYTHPAFTLNGHQLTGIWVGKFETSNVTTCTVENDSIGTGCDFTNLGIQIKPNVTSWRGARVGTFYTAIKNLSTTNNDSHMMKNMEWGAVAYLTKSQYGLGITDIGINNYEEYMTGCGIDAESNSSSTCNAYDTTNGKKASTTGNIYGIYDMSGGAWEYTMGTMAKTSTAPIIGKNAQYNSGFAGTYYNDVPAEGNNAEYTLDLAYTDLYSYDKFRYTRGRGKLGDATKEILTDYNGTSGYEGWTDDYAFFSYSHIAWLLRGGVYADGAAAGVLSFGSDSGGALAYYSARAVVSRAYAN